MQFYNVFVKQVNRVESENLTNFSVNASVYKHRMKSSEGFYTQDKLVAFNDIPEALQ